MNEQWQNVFGRKRQRELQERVSDEFEQRSKATAEHIMSNATDSERRNYKRCQCRKDAPACNKFVLGGNGNCVYCHHPRDCHPGKRPILRDHVPSFLKR